MIPALLLIPALAAGAGGLAGVFHGINNLAEAKELSKGAEALNEENLTRFKKAQEAQQESMQALGKTEMEVTSYFKYFTEAFEKIKNAPNSRNLSNLTVFRTLISIRSKRYWSVQLPFLVPLWVPEQAQRLVQSHLPVQPRQ